jgi:IS6 family transposase
VEELLAERGVEVDHVTVYRWVQRFTPLFADAARPLRHATGDRWLVDETYVKVAGRWRYLYRAVDQYGQVIDVLLSERRDTAAARWFVTRALAQGPAPVEVTADKAGPYLRVLDELVPAAAHSSEQYSNNRIEADHGRLKARLRPMRGLKRLRSAARLAAGHALVQNLRRGHYELATDATLCLRLATAFTELALRSELRTWVSRRTAGPAERNRAPAGNPVRAAVAAVADERIERQAGLDSVGAGNGYSLRWNLKKAGRRARPPHNGDDDQTEQRGDR